MSLCEVEVREFVHVIHYDDVFHLSVNYVEYVEILNASSGPSPQCFHDDQTQSKTLGHHSRGGT